MSDDTTAAPVTVDSLLQEHGADEAAISKIKDELGVTTVDDLGLLTETDLVDAGVKTVQARKLLNSLKPATPTPDAAAALGPVSFDGILPAVPDDGSWLEALKTGGVLKVDQSTVISAIRAALANRVGLFDVPKRLVEAMEKFADSIDEPVDPTYFTLRQQLTRRSYAEIFSAIPGLDANYVSDTRKKDLYHRIDQFLWPAIDSFNDQLRSWQELWMQQGANPALMQQLLLSTMGGGGMAMPPGMMQPPDTSGLRDYADAVNDAVNKVFAGTGAQIAAALAYEASQIKKSLEDPRLPAMVGAANRDLMLKQLGVSVSSTYPRLELNLTRFVLAIMQAKDIPAGNEELQYFGTLFMLGTQINWGELGGRGHVTGIAGNRL
jgi:hypothetical protein